MRIGKLRRMFSRQMDKQVVKSGAEKFRFLLVTTKGDEGGLSGIVEATSPAALVEVNILRLPVSSESRVRPLC